MSDIRDLQQNVADEVSINFEDIIYSDHPTDFLHEIADSGVPIYNYDLAQMLASDFNLAYVEDEDLVEGVTDVFRIISVAIYERLLQTAYEAYSSCKGDSLSSLSNQVSDIEVKLDLIVGALEELEGYEKTLANELREELQELEDKRDELNDKIDFIEGLD